MSISNAFITFERRTWTARHVRARFLHNRSIYIFGVVYPRSTLYLVVGRETCTGRREKKNKNVKKNVINKMLCFSIWYTIRNTAVLDTTQGQMWTGALHGTWNSRIRNNERPQSGGRRVLLLCFIIFYVFLFFWSAFPQNWMLLRELMYCNTRHHREIE